MQAFERVIIAKLLGLVGSAHDAEALAAARKAHDLVRTKGETWFDVLGVEPGQEESLPEPDHVIVARDLLKRGRTICTTWELRFLRGVLAFKTLSAQQRETLRGIGDKVLADEES